MRSIDELLEQDDPRWPDVQSWIAEATNSTNVLPPDDSSRAEALLATQVTTRSPMGAIIYETGGILVDGGWLRILGGGCDRFVRSLAQWNRDCGTMTDHSQPPFLLVADDVAGGFFAINGGVLGEDAGGIYYFDPSTLDWQSLEMGYTDFVLWAFTGDLQAFYADFRWTGWETEIAELTTDQAMSFYPFLCAEADSLDSRHRDAVPVLSAFNMQIEMARQLNS